MGKVILKWMLVCISILFLPYLGTKLMSSIGVNGARDKALEGNVIQSSVKIAGGMSLEEYIMGVLVATAPMNYEIESLKAQAVVVRTLVYNKYEQKKDGDNTVDINAIGLDYMNPSTLEEAYGKETYKKYIANLENAVYSTKGLILTYEGKPIQALYHEFSIGKTRSYEDAYGEAIPYLVSVPSDDVSLEEAGNTTELELDYVVDQLKEEFGVELSPQEVVTKISVLERDSNGYVKTVTVGDKVVTGEEMQKCLMLDSTNFYMDKYNEKLRIVCKGKGSGFGLSLYGSNRMATEGKMMQDILSYYYKGTILEEVNHNI